MKIPPDKQKPYMTPREFYKIAPNPMLRVIAWIILFVAMIFMVFVIKPSVTLARSETVQGTISNQVKYKERYKILYKTSIQYQNEIIYNRDMEYWRVSNRLGNPGNSVDLLIDKNGNIEIKEVVKKYQKDAILAVLTFPMIYFLLALVTVWSRWGDTKHELFSDARAIRLMPGFYEQNDWYETFPHLARMINPDTGNIEQDYVPPESETPKAARERFESTIKKYGFIPVPWMYRNSGIDI